MSDAGIAAREDVALPREAYSLLAQANLFRMRGCWDEAVQNCMAALRLAPDSPSAQSLLGDIYENQGRVDDAVQWYRMALDANPDSPADRLKLGRLLERQQMPLRPSAEEGSSSEPANSPSLKPAPTPLSRLLQITRDPETALRYAALLAAMLVLFTVAFAYGAIHHRAALAALGLGNSQEVRINPVVVPPASPPAAAVTVNVPRDPAEQTILDALHRASDLSALGITVIDVQSDPRAARLIVTIGLTSASSLTRAALLHSALQTLQDAAPLSPNSTLFTARCLTLPASEDDTGGPSLAFIGDLPAASLPAPTAAAPDDTQVQALFANSWWSPQMPS